MLNSHFLYESIICWPEHLTTISAYVTADQHRHYQLVALGRYQRQRRFQVLQQLLLNNWQLR